MNNTHSGYVMSNAGTEEWTIHLDGLFVFAGTLAACLEYIELLRT